MAKLASILKTDVMGDLSALAQLLQSKGRGKDTILAHITPAEAKRLKAAGGRGSRNPDTGLLEFDTTDVTPTPETVPEVTTTAAPITGGGGYDSGPPIPPSYASAQPVSSGPPSPTDSISINLPNISSSGQVTGATPTQITAPGLQQTAADIGAQQVPTTDQDLQEIKLAPGTQRIETPGTLQKIEQALGGPQGLVKLGLGGVGALLGGIGAKKSAQQIAAAQAEEQALAQPYQEAGRAMTGAAARGELSPASLQAYQAAQARMQQQAAATGGVGVEQQAAQLEQLRQNLLAQQYTYGLQIAQIGDNISIGAIKTGLQMDQALNSSTQNFYTNLASIIAGSYKPGQPTVTG